MDVKTLRAILSQYSDDTEVFVDGPMYDAPISEVDVNDDGSLVCTHGLI